MEPHYSTKHVHFYDLSLPPLLEAAVRVLSTRSFTLIDLGCGDGRIPYALTMKGLLKNAKRVVGVDISRIRIERLKRKLSFVEGIVADVQNLE